VRRLVASILCLLGILHVSPVKAGSESWLPASTKGYITVEDMNEMLSAFEHTGFGMMVKDQTMKAFIQDLEKQVSERFGVTGVRIGLSWNDVKSVCAKDACVAFIRPDDTVQKHSIATIVNVEGKDEEVKVLLDKIDESMKVRKAKVRTETWFTLPVSIYSVPTQNRKISSFDVAILVHKNFLIAADHPDVAKDILTRILGTAKSPNLESTVPFQYCMKRCAQDSAGVAPHVRWFFDPLGYAELAQEATGGRKKRRADFLKVLRNQGFDAIQGAGGGVHFNVEEFEILQRAFVYAPDVPGNSEARFKLAARVLNFHRVEDLSVPGWVPSSVNSYSAAAWGITDSYNYIGTLVDEVAGDEGFWEDLLDTIKNDRSGPQIDLNKVMTYFKSRVTAITDYKEPISATSERFLVAIDLEEPVKMREALGKALANDPDVNRVEAEDGNEIWEIVDAGEEIADFEIDADSGLGDDSDMDDEDFGDAPANPFLANAALSVVRGKFIVASHVDFIKEFIVNPTPEDGLADDEDFKAIDEALVKIGADKETAKIFSRAGREAHVSYELLRQGKMPESKGLIGKVLNSLLSSADTKFVREQRIDGKNMPEYPQVEKYLGTLGLYMRAEKDGWFVGGVTLRNPALGSTSRTEAAVETAAGKDEPSGG
jgi:hypothetical protein